MRARGSKPWLPSARHLGSGIQYFGSGCVSRGKCFFGAAPQAYAGTAIDRADRSALGRKIFLTGPLAAAPAVRKSRYSARSERAREPVTAPTAGAIPVKSARAPRAELFDVESEGADRGDRHRRGPGAARRADTRFRRTGHERGGPRTGNGRARRCTLLADPVRGRHALHCAARRARKIELDLTRNARGEPQARRRGWWVERNLEQALARYEQLLAKAANVAEATELEGQLMRVRIELDRVKTDTEWTKDRVARSTVYVTLGLQPDHEAFEPVAKFYPGVRAALLYDVPSTSASAPATAFAGGGFSLQWTRALDIDLDLLNNLREARGSAIDFYALTLGTAFYSDYLGGGRASHAQSVPWFSYRLRARSGPKPIPGRRLARPRALEERALALRRRSARLRAVRPQTRTGFRHRARARVEPRLLVARCGARRLAARPKRTCLSSSSGRLRRSIEIRELHGLEGFSGRRVRSADRPRHTNGRSGRA